MSNEDKVADVLASILIGFVVLVAIVYVTGMQAPEQKESEGSASKARSIRYVWPEARKKK